MRHNDRSVRVQLFVCLGDRHHLHRTVSTCTLNKLSLKLVLQHRTVEIDQAEERGVDVKVCHLLDYQLLAKVVI